MTNDTLNQSIFMKACRREAVPRTPVWLMRQAGRYMKEYRELREKASFIELCSNPDLATQVTVEATEKLGVDAAILFSDILLILKPLGFGLSYEKDEGPRISNPFTGEHDLPIVSSDDVLNELKFVFNAVKKIRKELKPDIPLIGFSGAPFTLASYLIEGGSSKNFIKTKSLMHNSPDTWHSLMEILSTNLAQYLNEQIYSGTQAVQIFDSWVGALTPNDYRKFVLPHSKRLIDSVRKNTPIIHFGTQTSGFISDFASAGGNVIGIDWRQNLDDAWDAFEEKVIMGNLDPSLLFTNPNIIKAEVQRILNQTKNRPGHIFNLGHGVLPGTPVENVLSLIQSVRELSSKTIVKTN